MALVIRLITIGGVLLVTMIPVPGLADSNGSCSATGSIAGCLGDRNGTIDVSGEVRRRGRQGQQSRPHAPTAIASEAAATAAYCADAAANANATTTVAASAEIVPICGFVPLRGSAAPPSPGAGRNHRWGRSRRRLRRSWLRSHSRRRRRSTLRSLLPRKLLPWAHGDGFAALADPVDGPLR